MNVFDILILLGVAVLAFFAIRAARKKAKTGGCSCGGGCSGCSGCSSCSGCSAKKDE